MKLKPARCLSWILCLGAITLSSCANPVAETYQKSVDGGEKAIDKAHNVQQTVDQTKTSIEQQAKTAESSSKSP